MRHKAAKVERAYGRCRECSWTTTTAGAIAAAAKHHDDTGHQVEASQTIRVLYGRSRLQRLTH